MRPAFSIVMPVYNRAGVVLRALESIEAQDYRPLHLILVDNNSTDGTLAVLLRWGAAHSRPDLRVTVVQEAAPGAAAARERGDREVQSEYMMHFDSDDVMLPGAVSLYMESFARHPEAGIVRTRMEDAQRPGRVRVHPLRSGGDELVQHLHHATLGTQRYAVRTSLLRRAGGWDTSLRIWDDWELGLRLLLQNPEVVAVPRVTARAVASAGSVTGELWSTHAERYERAIASAEAALHAATLPAARRAKLLALMRYRRAMLAAHFRREGHAALAAPMLARALQGAPLRQRVVLRLAYGWTRAGMRGGASIANLLL